jgi:hypothetical protein
MDRRPQPAGTASCRGASTTEFSPLLVAIGHDVPCYNAGVDTATFEREGGDRSSTVSLEERVAALEAEVARLKQERANATLGRQPWWEEIRGRFKGDPLYAEAMRLGREYRESLRPKNDEEVEG